MKKLKIYLDTSVISHLLAEDTPEKMADTRTLWNEIKHGKYTVIISDVTIAELSQCAEEKFNRLLAFVRQIQFETFEVDDEAKNLANQYIKNEVLRPKSYDDCLHIACSVLSCCDLLVSWNFKHLVNFKTIKGVRIVNALNNYNEIGILSPSMLIEWEE